MLLACHRYRPECPSFLGVRRERVTIPGNALIGLNKKKKKTKNSNSVGCMECSLCADLHEAQESGHATAWREQLSLISPWRYDSSDGSFFVVAEKGRTRGKRFDVPQERVESVPWLGHYWMDAALLDSKDRPKVLKLAWRLMCVCQCALVRPEDVLLAAGDRTKHQVYVRLCGVPVYLMLNTYVVADGNAAHSDSKNRAAHVVPANWNAFCSSLVLRVRGGVEMDDSLQAQIKELMHMRWSELQKQQFYRVFERCKADAEPADPHGLKPMSISSEPVSPASGKTSRACSQEYSIVQAIDCTFRHVNFALALADPGLLDAIADLMSLSLRKRARDESSCAPLLNSLLTNSFYEDAVLLARAVVAQRDSPPEEVPKMDLREAEETFEKVVASGCLNVALYVASKIPFDPGTLLIFYVDRIKTQGDSVWIALDDGKPTLAKDDWKPEDCYCGVVVNATNDLLCLNPWNVNVKSSRTSGSESNDAILCLQVAGRVPRGILRNCDRTGGLSECFATVALVDKLVCLVRWEKMDDDIVGFFKGQSLVMRPKFPVLEYWSGRVT